MNLYKVWLAGGRCRYIQASHSERAVSHALRYGHVESVTLCTQVPINIEIEVAQ